MLKKLLSIPLTIILFTINAQAQWTESFDGKLKEEVASYPTGCWVMLGNTTIIEKVDSTDQENTHELLIKGNEVDVETPYLTYGGGKRQWIQVELQTYGQLYDSLTFVAEFTAPVPDQPIVIRYNVKVRGNYAGLLVIPVPDTIKGDLALSFNNFKMNDSVTIRFDNYYANNAVLSTNPCLGNNPQPEEPVVTPHPTPLPPVVIVSPPQITPEKDYKQYGFFRIRNEDTPQTIIVYDLTGKLLTQYDNVNEFPVLPKYKGVFVVKLITDNALYSIRVMML